MSKALLPILAVAAAIALSASCSKSEETKSEKPNSEAVTPGEGAKTAETGDTGKVGALAKGERPKVELLAKAVERRLHPDRVEASSFLWTNFNKFQENYHPLYLVDDDPRTAWVEGASGAGENEWVRIHVTEVAEATKVKLRIRNGYHKSKSLHKKNARAESITVTLLPGEDNAIFKLKDDMEWQTIEMEQPSGPLEAIEIRVDSVFPGSKYADLCLSDAVLFVTSRTPENPDFERRKFEEVIAWKKERLEAAKLFGSEQAKELPIAAGYKVIQGKKVGPEDKKPDGALPLVTRMIEYSLSANVGNADVLTAALTAAKANFADWVPVEVSVAKARAIPAVDGLYQPESWQIMAGGSVRNDAFAMPAPGKLEFLSSGRISAFEGSGKTTVKSALAAKAKVCKRENKPHLYYFRPKSEVSNKDIGRLLIVQCGQEEEREGYYTYSGLQLLEYDGSGQLSMVISPNSIVQYNWANKKLLDGQRVRLAWNAKYSVDKLVPGKAN